MCSSDLKLQLHSFVDTTKNLGTVSGVFTVVGSKKSTVNGKVTGVVSDGSISGLATGTAKGANGAFTASLGGSFSQTGGFTAASLGGPETGAGAVVANGNCAKVKK